MTWAEVRFLVRHPLVGLETLYVRTVLAGVFYDTEKLPRDGYECHPSNVTGEPLDVAAVMLGLIKKD